jgi:nicotinamide-nucleotide amidase
VGTELLLGSNLDTNSQWIGEQLAEHGVDSFFHTSVGDNHGRIVSVLRLALSRSDAVIVTGGLGPTQDDITREAIAEVMGVEMSRDSEQVQRIVQSFERRGRVMSQNNLRQADRPVGSLVIPDTRGTAPGLICPVGDQVIYAVPGVPWEMREMVTNTIVPDLVRRSGTTAVIRTRTLRTWGASESAVAEMVQPRIDALDETGAANISFLAKGINGIHVRISTKAATAAAADAVIAAEEAELRGILGDLIFGVDDETMESVIAALMLENGLTLGLAESLTGGLIAQRMTEAQGASKFFRGGIVSYASEVKFSLLNVPEGPVVCEVAARAMAENARKALGADVAVSVTGVAGPDTQDGQPVGTVFAGLALPDGSSDVFEFHLPGDRQRIREYTCINALNELRKRLTGHSVEQDPATESSR